QTLSSALRPLRARGPIALECPSRSQREIVRGTRLDELHDIGQACARKASKNGSRRMPREIEGNRERSDAQRYLRAAFGLGRKRTTGRRRIVGHGGRDEKIEPLEAPRAPVVELGPQPSAFFPELGSHLPPELDGGEKGASEIGLPAGEVGVELR